MLILELGNVLIEFNRGNSLLLTVAFLHASCSVALVCSQVCMLSISGLYLSISFNLYMVLGHMQSA